MAKIKKIIKLYFSFSILSVFCVSCMSLGAGKTFQRFVEYAPYDAVIVPGVPFENGEWSEIMKYRVHWAVSLHKKGIAKNIIFSGSAVYTPYSEAKIMRLYALELGVDASNIYLEERAEHSTENLYYSYLIAKKNGLEKIALTTDPFQNSFLRGFAQKINLEDIGFMPIVFEELNKMELSSPEIDYNSIKVQDFVSLPERETPAQRFKGTMGKYIAYEPGYDPRNKTK